MKGKKCLQRDSAAGRRGQVDRVLTMKVHYKGRWTRLFVLDELLVLVTFHVCEFYNPHKKGKYQRKMRRVSFH